MDVVEIVEKRLLLKWIVICSFIVCEKKKSLQCEVDDQVKI